MNKLLSYMHRNITFEFDSGDLDNEKAFQKHLQRMPKHWIYRTKKIFYTYNSDGFRERSLSNVDWANSIVVLGCSNVQGAGLANEDTFCRRLEEILSIPVVNLGVGGSSISFACWNSTILHEYYPRPKAVIHFWTSLYRYVNVEDNKLVRYLPTTKGYCANHNWEHGSIMHVMADRGMWRGKLPYYEASFFEDTAKKLNVNYYPSVDLARDLNHPGIETNLIAAKTIADYLKTQGV
jgi:hypothetical protein